VGKEKGFQMLKTFLVMLQLQKKDATVMMIEYLKARKLKG
jgi:hypothetical protein